MQKTITLNVLCCGSSAVNIDTVTAAKQIMNAIKKSDSMMMFATLIVLFMVFCLFVYLLPLRI